MVEYSRRASQNPFKGRPRPAGRILPTPVLVCQDLFDRTVDAKEKNKTKDSKATVRAFFTMITTKNPPNENWVDKVTEFAGEFKKLWNAEGIQVYSTLSETKAAYAERTIRSLKKILYHYIEDNGCKYIQTKAAYAERTIRSLKKILYRYIEDNGCKYIHKLTQFGTTLNSRRTCSIDLIPKIVQNSDFLSIMYSKPLREFRKPKFKIGATVRISKCDLPFRKGYKPQFTQEVFEIVAISPRKPLTYTKKIKMRLSAVIFIRKS